MLKNQGGGYLVAVAPQHGATSHQVIRYPKHETASHELMQCRAQSNLDPRSKHRQPPLQDVWVFIVAGDYMDLKELLFDLGGRGAMRWDLHECYTVVQKALGEGGAGQVFIGQSLIAKEAQAKQRKGEETSRGALSITQVAVKRFNDQSERVGDVIWKEVGVLARASSHPNIVKLFGPFCEHEGRENQEGPTAISWFIVMELFSSGDLFDVLSERCLNVDEMSILIAGLSSALKHLHARRIMHRDVKPENLLMGAHLQPILADMGIAADLDDAVEMNKVCGSPGYAAPEVVTQQRYNEIADVFSAGAVYYFAITGYHPFQTRNLKGTSERTVKFREKYPMSRFHKVPAGLKNLIKSCLSKNPATRPSAQQCLDALSLVDIKGPMQHLVSEAAPRGLHVLAGTESQKVDQQQAAVAFREPQGQCHQGESMPDESGASASAPVMGSSEDLEPNNPDISVACGRTAQISSSAAPTHSRHRSRAAVISSGVASSSSCAKAGSEAAQAPPSAALNSHQSKGQQITSSHHKMLQPFPPKDDPRTPRCRLRLPAYRRRPEPAEHTEQQQKEAPGEGSMLSKAWRWVGS